MLALLLTAAFASEPPWLGAVRLSGPDAVEQGLFRDPGLTERSPHYDRQLAADALNAVDLTGASWVQAIPGARMLDKRQPVTDVDEEAGAAAVQAYLRRRGFPDAEVLPRWVPRNERRHDLWFDVDLGPGAYTGPDKGVVELEPGWSVRPVVAALGRGAAMSAYGGIKATRLAPSGDTVLLHGEGGLRAFPDSEQPPFGGNIGLWSTGRVRWQAPMTDHASLVLDGQMRTDSWPGVNVAEPKVAVGVRWDHAPRWSLEVDLTTSRHRAWAWEAQERRFERFVGEDAPLVGNYDTVRLDLLVAHDTTDCVIQPRRGTWVSAAVTPIGAAAGGAFTRADVQARGFVPIDRGRWVAFARARAGALWWNNDSNRSLLGERLHAGASDLRAWGRRQVRPPNYDGDAWDLRIGGDFVTIGTLGTRWHIHPDFAVGAFADAGRVWERVDQIAPDALLADVGASVAVRTVIGVVRVDIAVPTARQPTDGPAPVALQLWVDDLF